MLARRLKLDVRGFYRDLELLRAFGVPVTSADGRYRLDESLTAALARLPLPDPHLTLAEAEQLAKGRTAAHRKLKAILETMKGPA
jgi:predicted DNA-binding transcriptional regulator YafY